MKMDSTLFGKREDGDVIRYTFTTDANLSFSVINYGATLIDVRMPDSKGIIRPVITGFDTLEEYVNHEFYFGATIGRFGNRIAGASFTVEGTEYKLEANNGTNNLHGGPRGFDSVVWEGDVFLDDEKGGVRFSYVSPDGECGFPGTLKTEVTYTFTEKGEIRIDYRAETDKTTPVNLTNHTYWNMAGLTGSETVLDQEMTVNASSYTPVDERQIPTGIEPVEGTPMDFRKAAPIGRKDKTEGCYDHNWVLDGEGLREAAVLSHAASGRKVTVLTDQPGIQVYTSVGMAEIPERNGKTYPYMAAALETQNFPNCVNEPDFPNCLLKPGETYESTTIFKLTVE